MAEEREVSGMTPKFSGFKNRKSWNAIHSDRESEKKSKFFILPKLPHAQQKFLRYLFEVHLIFTCGLPWWLRW